MSMFPKSVKLSAFIFLSMGLSAESYAQTGPVGAPPPPVAQDAQAAHDVATQMSEGSSPASAPGVPAAPANIPSELQQALSSGPPPSSSTSSSQPSPSSPSPSAATPPDAPPPAPSPAPKKRHASPKKASHSQQGTKAKQRHRKKAAPPPQESSAPDKNVTPSADSSAGDTTTPSALPFKQMPRSQGIYDLSPLPVYHGVVAQFLPAIQEGGIIGFMLTDGTEVLIPTEASDSILRILNVGEKVDIQGLRGRVLPIMQAFAISTTRGNVSRGDFIAMPHHSREMMAGTDFILHGPVWLSLYNVEGQLCGAILQDHSVLYMTPSEAVHVVDLLQPGKTLYVVGSGSSGDLGLAVNVREIGTSTDKLINLVKNTAPPPGPPAGSAAYDIIRGSEER